MSGALTSRLRSALAAGAAGAMVALAGVTMPAVALAQASAAAPAQMLLEADTLIYDQDDNTVTAAGHVRIEYRGDRLVADRVIYDRDGRRLMAYGNVQMLDAKGTRTFGDEVDISDDFREGFVNALQIETADKVYFGAESGERRDGHLTILNSGVYTACAPCEEKPDKAPIWRIKSARIVWNGKQKIVRFERSRFELFGLPIAYVPAFELPDPTVKRKSGFLFPTISFGPSELGVGIGIPYYWALSPSYDLLGTFTGLTKQGLLTDLEFRQRFNSGDYSIRAAGIYQLQPALFGVNTHGAANRFRGMIGTTGRFDINPRWTAGWKYLLQTDENFSHDYSIPGYADHKYVQTVYLTGLNDRNFLDLRLQQFKIQEEFTNRGISQTLPYVAPLVDYSYTIDRAVAGGELSFGLNMQHVGREALARTETALADGYNIRGIAGRSARLTAEAQWRTRLVAPGGLVLTPLLHARGDAVFTSLSADTQTAITRARLDGIAVPSDLRSNYQRAMVTAGLEASWPILFTTPRTTHVVEPVAQIFVRPDAPYGSVLAIPNEDAQSMVFDAGNLFERDKFSGYDLMEGGVRANLGLRYTGTFGAGWVVSALGGQSYHLAGVNPFAAPNLVNAGAYSGLETARSDYVGAITLRAPNGAQFMAGTRLDETSLAVRRVDLRASGKIGPVTASVGYAYIQAQPLYGFANDRHQASLSASAKFFQNWRGFGSVAYDIEAMNLAKTSIGFSYDDECFGITFSASQTYGANNRVAERSIGFQLSFRTIGDFGQTAGLAGQ